MTASPEFRGVSIYIVADCLPFAMGVKVLFDALWVMFPVERVRSALVVPQTGSFDFPKKMQRLFSYFSTAVRCCHRSSIRNAFICDNDRKLLHKEKPMEVPTHV